MVFFLTTTKLAPRLLFGCVAYPISDVLQGIRSSGGSFFLGGVV